MHLIFYTKYILLSSSLQHQFRETRMMNVSCSSCVECIPICCSAFALKHAISFRFRFIRCICSADIIQSANPFRNASIPLRISILSVAFYAWTSSRPISNSQLHMLPCFHLCPIYLVFFKGSSSCDWRSYLEGGFTLRCLQRLSRPDLATLPCIW